MSVPFIPPATAAKLAAPIPKGERHAAKKDIAISLIGNGLSPTAVEQTLRDKFPDSRAGEIEGVVRWAVDHHPTPSGYGDRTFAPRTVYQKVERTVENPKRSFEEQCRWWMGDATMTLDEVMALSPVPFKGSLQDELLTFLETLYAADESVNVVCKFTETDGKANPYGSGNLSSRLQWCDYIRAKGIPCSRAGAWTRPNPCGEGTGKDGAITDADVTDFRYLLIESDKLPIGTQLALYVKLKLPIAAMIMSGGKSAHAWLAVNCSDETAYRDTAKKVLATLAPFGIDPANKNPSRLSRLPSAKRVIGSHGDGIQKLLYLAHRPDPFKPATLENLVSFPLVDEKPMCTLMNESVPRYEELYKNRGKLGVRVGLSEFDNDTGGLKPKQMTVIAAGTNHGKSTVALNFINGALHNGHGVALFTLEMDREEIADLIVANNCRINRNCFNTGFFSEPDLEKIVGSMPRISRLPLWIYDDASMTVDQIRDRVAALKSENKIEMVVIDYIQIVTHPDSRLPREQQVAEIARGIRMLAKDSNLPFVILSQLNDDGKLRESRVVAHEAHNVILIEPNEQQTMMSMRVIKGRRIMKKEYQLSYQPEFARVSQNKIDKADFPETN